MLPVLSSRQTVVSNLTKSILARDLERRLSGPQRHRLLHGFPLAGALPVLDPDTDVKFPELRNSKTRSLLVGVLPHPFCNPRVAACGFCTFPHEAFRADRVSRVSESVCREITARANSDERFNGRQVTGLYFGGGTANLTPPDDFRRLCRLLNATFDLSDAEITLEGIPVMFLRRQGALLDILEGDVSSSRIRFSMGIQTFDESRLREMGRQSFGDLQTFTDVVQAAHARNWSVSADLLFNLPDQTLKAMQADVQTAIDLGLDQICLYHLVLFRGLGTPWAADEEKLAGLPENEAGAENWLALREQLLDAGFVQTSLTNFERAEVHQSDRRYLYEECGFNANDFEMVGFGPGGISFQANDEFSQGVKTVNPESSHDYMSAVDRPGRSWNRYFNYEAGDLKVFSLTRQLAGLKISTERYRRSFGTSLQTDFGEEFELLIERDLLTFNGIDFAPTPKGMFYADSTAGLLALRRLQQLRSTKRGLILNRNDNLRGHM